MKILKWFLGGIFAASMILIILTSAIEIALYSDFSFYEKEYKKFGVKDAVDMEMEDIMDVTRGMMGYLKDQREELQIETTVGGHKVNFFNEREISHMEDVKNLFMGGLFIRKICIIAALICAALLLLTAKSKCLMMLARSLQAGVGIFFLAGVILAVVISTNFSQAFIIFHKIFFNNDLWLLDPDTDRLINILPEGFFVDTAVRIGTVFGILILIILLVAIILEHVIMKRKNRRYL